jgi:hypothetical protein
MKPREKPKMIPYEEQTMPCPVCGFEQTAMAYWARPTAGQGKEDGVPCLCCGVEIRHCVPFATICAMPFGWYWKRVEKEGDAIWEYVLGCFVTFAEVETATEAFQQAKHALFLALNGLSAAKAKSFFETSVVRARLGQSYVNLLRTDYDAFRAVSTHKNSS